MFHFVRSKAFFLLNVILWPLFLLGAPDPASAAINAGDVLINEFVAAPQSTQSSEWVELYNTSTADLDLSGYWIDDIGGGGSAPKEIPAGTTIPAGGYYVMDLSSFLNNGGDDVRLLTPDQSTVLDSYTYSSASYDMSWCRKPDGGSWSSTECDPTKGSSNGGGTSVREPGTFEIYFFDVEQGHSHLVVTPSGKSILIEAGEVSWNSGRGAAMIASALDSILGTRHLNYMVISHYHYDHMGYVGYGGFWSLLEEHGVTADVLLDRDGGTWVDSNNDGACDPDTEIDWHNVGTTSGTGKNWICYATDPRTKAGKIRQVMDIGQVIDFGDGVTMELVMRDGIGVMQADGTTPVSGDWSDSSLPPSENDYSQNFVIRYNDLEFVTGGDTDGEYATSEWGYTYNDVERHVAEYINRAIDVLHVNHHGSSHSTSQFFVDVLRPTVSLISCGDNSYGHPAQIVLDRLRGAGSDIYQTNQCDPERDYTGVEIVNGDVTLRSPDGQAYEIVGYASYTAKAPDTYDVEDVVINEILPAPKKESVEWIEFYNPTGVDIDIGGTWVDDVANGGQSPVQIPNGTVVPADGYWVWESASGFLNNSGDDARYLSADGVTVYDAFTYGSTSYDASWYRSPDGGAWASTYTKNPTKGAANP